MRSQSLPGLGWHGNLLAQCYDYLPPPPPPPTETIQYNQNNSKSFPYSRIGGYKLKCLREARKIKITLQSIFPSSNFLRTFHEWSRHDLS